MEDQIEAQLRSTRPSRANTVSGRVTEAGREQERYLDYVLSTLARAGALAGLRVVVDCAHGAASRRIAGRLVTTIGPNPTG